MNYQSCGSLISAIMFFLLFAAPASAEYVMVKSEAANIRVQPTLEGTVIAAAKSGDVFRLSKSRGDWFEIYMFSGEPRFIHRSVATLVNSSPPLPSSAEVRRNACIELVKAQDRAVNEATRKYPTDYSRQIDYERMLYDKYELPVFHKYRIPPAQNSKLVLECAKKRWLP